MKPDRVAADSASDVSGWAGLLAALTYLPVQVQQIKGKDVDLDLDILCLDVLPLPLAQLLERQDLAHFLVPCDRLRVEHEALRLLFDSLLHVFDEIRVLDTHVFAVPREDGQLAVIVVNLRSLSIVLVLAGELLPFEPVQHFCNRFGRLGQHRLQRYTRGELDCLSQLLWSPLEQRWDNHIVAGAFGEYALQNMAALCQIFGNSLLR